MRTITELTITGLIIAVLSVGVLYERGLIGPTVCEKTFRYSVGTVDPRFGLDKEDFTALLKEAENVWESQTGLNLFELDPNSKFKIELIFDERQARTIAEENDRTLLNQLSSIYDNLSVEHRLLVEEYQTRIAEFSVEESRYSAKLQSYNAEVSRWNKRGGAPDDVYSKLQAEREELSRLALDLEGDRDYINTLVSKLNLLTTQTNAIAKEYNNSVSTYTERYGGTHEFNQGEYRESGISIFQFDDEGELPLVLAHELGHALGLGHVGNERSLMYYLMGEQSLDPVRLSNEDISALNVVCRR